jgi:hypothetical protein
VTINDYFNGDMYTTIQTLLGMHRDETHPHPAVMSFVRDVALNQAIQQRASAQGVADMTEPAAISRDSISAEPDGHNPLYNEDGFTVET